MANRLQAHKKHISNPLQSAYRKHLSTVSALLKVRNDIIVSMDKGEVTALALHDLSAVEYSFKRVSFRVAKKQDFFQNCYFEI